MRNVFIALLILLSGVVLADPPTIRTVDFAVPSSAPTLEVYQHDSKTLTVNLLNNTASLSTNGYTPVFYFYGPATVNVACAWTTTNCTMQVSLTTNNLSTVGAYTYAAGVSNASGVTVAQRGTLRITANPNH
jgi:hypothetical protein